MQEQENTATEVNSQSRELGLLIVSPSSPEPIFELIDGGRDIDIREEITYEEWHEGLKAFYFASTHLKRCAGKYLAFGRRKFGEQKMQESVQQLEFDLPLVYDALAIANLPAELQRPGITPDHMVILGKAGLKKKELKYWADAIVAQQLSPSRLRESINEGEIVTDAAAKQRRQGYYSAHGIRGEADIWLKKMGGIEGLLKLSLETQGDIVSEFSLFIEICAALSENISRALQQTRSDEEPVEG